MSSSYSGYTGWAPLGLTGSSGVTIGKPEKPDTFIALDDVIVDISTMTQAEIAADRETAILAVVDVLKEKITKAYPKVACSVSSTTAEDGDVRCSIKLKTAVDPSKADAINRGMLEIWKEVREFYNYVMIGSEFTKLAARLESATLTNEQFAKVFRQVFDAKKA